MVIETAETYFPTINRAVARGQADKRAPILRKPFWTQPLRAEINHGRFIVQCPSCSNAEFLWEDMRFWCSECENKSIGGDLYRVVIPTERLKIEATLLARPIRNQNWRYPETFKDLMAENELHSEELE